jgi:hypothetical protein
MTVEELIGHVEQMPAGGVVDVYIDPAGARFLSAHAPDVEPVFLMIASPEDPPQPEPVKPKRTRAKKAD